MGEPKAGVRWRDGATLGELAETALLGASCVVVVLGHGDGLSPRGGRLHQEDKEPGGGPLQAIATLLASGLGSHYIIAPCDMPGIDAELLRLLVDRACWTSDGQPSDAEGAVFINRDGRPQPLPICLSATVLARVTALVAAGERRLGALHASLDLRAVALPGDADAALHNVNRADDLAPSLAPSLTGPGVSRLGRPATTPAERSLAAPHDIRSIVATPPTPAMAQDVPIQRIGVLSGAGTDAVAVEAPLQILLGPAPLAVLMRTPGHDTELVTGFLLSEGIIHAAADLSSVAPCEDVDLPAARGHVVRANLQPGVTIDVSRIARNTYVGSSCGICGQASIERALQVAGAVPHRLVVSPDVLVALPGKLRAAQATFALTGGLHAAALFDVLGNLLVVREDVGRHNAVDKVLGFAARAHIAPASFGLFVSGRVSFEIVQKAMAARVGLVAGVSAPTSLAVDLAAQGGVSLYGFVRGGRATQYGEATASAAERGQDDDVGL